MISSLVTEINFVNDGDYWISAQLTLPFTCIKVTDHLVSAWEVRNVGDKISATPARDGFFSVHIIDKEKDFVIGGEQERMGGPFKMTWAFNLEPVGEDSCRLITRGGMKSTPLWAAWIMGKIFYPPVHGLMSKVQLATIKKYAERDALGRTREPVAVAA